MRYVCQEEGFGEAFVEFLDTGWTRADLRRLRDLDESSAWFGVLRQRVVALHLPVVGGEPLTDINALTPDVLDQMDIVVYNWFVATIIEAMRDVTHLGNAPWRRLSSMQEAASATNSPTP